MSFARIAAAAHRWITLFVGIQVLLWIASGAFFAIVPIERVRSEHRIREVKSLPLDAAIPAALPRIVAGLPGPPTRLVLEHRTTGPVVLAEFADRRPLLYDATSGQRLAPIDADAAARLARDYVLEKPAVANITEVTAAGPEYRGALPAWRVQFTDAEGLAVYVARDTATVTARRSDLWRLYDALWALHIMDWRNHEDFNNGLLVTSSVAGLVVAISGIALLPFRFRWRRRRAVSAITPGDPA